MTEEELVAECVKLQPDFKVTREILRDGDTSYVRMECRAGASLIGSARLEKRSDRSALLVQCLEKLRS